MMNLNCNTLMSSEYDMGMNEITLTFEDGDKRAFARGIAPEESFTDENYFDDEENLLMFLMDADIEEEEE